MSSVPSPSFKSAFAASLLAPAFVPPPPTIKGDGKSWVVSLILATLGTGIGASTMTGGGGNDVFYVHSGADHVVAPAGPGRSTVIVDGFASYTLTANVANLSAWPR